MLIEKLYFLIDNRYLNYWTTYFIDPAHQGKEALAAGLDPDSRNPDDLEDTPVVLCFSLGL